MKSNNAAEQIKDLLSSIATNKATRQQVTRTKPLAILITGSTRRLARRNNSAYNCLQMTDPS